MGANATNYQDHQGILSSQRLTHLISCIFSPFVSPWALDVAQYIKILELPPLFEFFCYQNFPLHGSVSYFFPCGELTGHKEKVFH